MIFNSSICNMNIHEFSSISRILWASKEVFKKQTPVQSDRVCSDEKILIRKRNFKFHKKKTKIYHLCDDVLMLVYIFCWQKIIKK